MERNELIAKVRQVAYDLHVYLGTGLLEKVYESGIGHKEHSEHKERGAVDGASPENLYALYVLYGFMVFMAKHVLYG